MWNAKQARNATRNSAAAAIVPLIFMAAAMPLAGQTDPMPFTLDNERMANFEFWIGTWGPHTDSAGADAYREVYEWAIPGKAVRRIEYRRIDGVLQPISQALIGFHYGFREIRFMEFVRDGLSDFEVLLRNVPLRGWLDCAFDGAAEPGLRSGHQ